MVHFNTKYGTITDAIDKEDGIAVVAILFQVSFDIAYLYTISTETYRIFYSTD